MKNINEFYKAMKIYIAYKKGIITVYNITGEYKSVLYSGTEIKIAAGFIDTMCKDVTVDESLPSEMIEELFSVWYKMAS